MYIFLFYRLVFCLKLIYVCFWHCFLIYLLVHFFFIHLCNSLFSFFCFSIYVFNFVFVYFFKVHVFNFLFFRIFICSCIDFLFFSCFHVLIGFLFIHVLFVHDFHLCFLFIYLFIFIQFFALSILICLYIYVLFVVFLCVFLFIHLSIRYVANNSIFLSIHVFVDIYVAAKVVSGRAFKSLSAVCSMHFAWQARHFAHVYSVFARFCPSLAVS